MRVPEDKLQPVLESQRSDHDRPLSEAAVRRGAARDGACTDRRAGSVTDRAGSADDGESFLDAFETLAQAIRRARGSSAQTTGGLTFSQYALIRALADRETARVNDLAGDAEVTASTATRILDTLERRDMVRRRRAAEDRRGVTVSLTPAGRAALDRQDAWMRGRQLAFYDGLPEVEKALAPDLLVRMAALIDELANGPSD